MDGTVVDLAVNVDTYHADRMWQAWYCVHDRVGWGSAAADVEPRDGELLECRSAE